MGKNNWPDFDAIIQKAVNAGRAQGMSIAKDAYKATERRLYALPVLRQKVEDDKEKLEQIKTHGPRSGARALCGSAAPATGSPRRRCSKPSSKTSRPP